MKNVISFSGGKDSTAMLLMMIEKNIKIDYIVHVDTTKEFPEIYEHIEKVQKAIRPLVIDIVQFDFDYWLGEHVKTKGKNKGKSGYGWADFRNRWCTRLKVEEIKKYVSKIDNDVVEYIGIAYDEKHRVNNFIPPDRERKKVKFPLVEWEITEKMALEYCYSHGFDFNGLYNHFSRLSCFCCPLSRIGELRHVYWNYPSLWKKMRELDKKSYRDFRPDYTLNELEEKFVREKNRKNNA